MLTISINSRIYCKYSKEIMIEKLNIYSKWPLNTQDEITIFKQLLFCIKIVIYWIESNLNDELV
jgi:hypothetical protein